MAYHLPHCLILHIPKTGSDWVRNACQEGVAGTIREVGRWHCDLNTARAEILDQRQVLPFVGTFIRHPLTWYRSAWCYWRQTGRFPREAEAPRVETDDFSQFVQNCLVCEPEGYVTALYRRFIGRTLGEVSFIGRQECLAEDLVMMLTLAGEQIDEDALRNTPRQNVRGSQSPVEFPGFSHALAREVLLAEADIIERFY
jgi:hypothetical protein